MPGAAGGVEGSGGAAGRIHRHGHALDRGLRDRDVPVETVEPVEVEAAGHQLDGTRGAQRQDLPQLLGKIPTWMVPSGPRAMPSFQGLMVWCREPRRSVEVATERSVPTGGQPPHQGPGFRHQQRAVPVEHEAGQHRPVRQGPGLGDAALGGEVVGAALGDGIEPPVGAEGHARQAAKGVARQRGERLRLDDAAAHPPDAPALLERTIESAAASGSQPTNGLALADETDGWTRKRHSPDPPGPRPGRRRRWCCSPRPGRSSKRRTPPACIRRPLHSRPGAGSGSLAHGG